MLRRFSSITKYKAHTTTVLFVFGFIFDMVMLPGIDHPITRYIGLAHLCIVAFLIMFRELVISRNTASKGEQKLYSLASFGISFSSGAALSFIFVYSLRSAAFLVSWPLLLLLVLCIIANEFVSTHDFRFTLDIGILLVALLFFIIFNMPLILNKENDWVFALSIGVSIVLSLLYLFCLQYTSESARYEAPRSYALAIGIPMFVGMLYFLNVIPAVPLSLKDAGVYHHITHTQGGEFLAQQEDDVRILKKYRATLYHSIDASEGVYFFSNIDTPAQLTAPISHVWEYYDTKTHRWIFASKISFDIQGGRDNGYRAFSYRESITEGLWRVTVKIGDNRIIGREKFEVIYTPNRIATKEISL
jgi:hypothetical protein